MTLKEADLQIQAVGVSRRFGALRALDNVSLDIRRGEFLTLLGPSGSGKTTFLNILAGFDRPTEGKLMQGGRDVTRVPAEDRNFGMVFQGYALFPHLSVERNVAFPLRVRGVDAARQKTLVSNVIARVGLSAHAHKMPSQLSGGQQQRVALARALVFSPDLLLLDEPLSALDKSMREQLQSELQRIHREFQTTFVFVTHDQSEALALSSRVAIFDRGRLTQVATPEEIYRRPASLFVAEFLGQINLLPVTGAGQAAGAITADFNGRQLRAPGSAQGALWFGVRPEHAALSVSEPAGDVNAVTVTLNAATYLGATVQLSLSAANAATERPLTVVVPAEEWSQRPLTQGQTAWLAWPPRHTLTFPREIG